jgi:hypothetical protein
LAIEGVACFGARDQGRCDNLLTIRRDEVEARVLTALEEKLLRQDLFEEFCDEFTREMNRLRMAHRANFSAAECEIERIEVRRKRLIEMVMEGVPPSEVRNELTANAAKREELKARLAAACGWLAGRGETGWQLICAATTCSKIASDRPIYLEKFHRRASNFDESDDHSWTGAVRRNDHFLSAHGEIQVVHLECHMRDGFNQVGIRRIRPVPLPLDAERVALMVTHRDSQVGKIDFPFKASRCRNANVIEFHTALDTMFLAGVSAPSEPELRLHHQSRCQDPSDRV